jgi:hypothetical protein
MKRLKSAIVLYQPNNISRNVTANWEDSDLGMMGRMFNGNDIAAAKATMEQGDNQARGSYLMTLLPLAILGNSDLGNLVSTKTRRIMSPSRAQVFKGVSYRNFSFEFVFAPVTPEETTNVDNIIKTFRKNMLPTDMTSRGQPMLWKYPNTFDIVHYARGRVNPHIPKISTCALVSCDVNYTPSGQWNELGGKSNMSGAPAQIQMQLVFQELELLTSDRIDQGF